MRALSLTLLALVATTQPAWACKNAMGPTGTNAQGFWMLVGSLVAVAFFTGLYLYGRFKGGE